MPTIAEIIAAKKAAASAAASPAPAKVETPGKPSGRSIVLRAAEAESDKPKNEMDQGYPPKWLLERRSLSEVKGEGIMVPPPAADPATLAWYAALQAFETELCAMRHPEDPEAVWLAVRWHDKPELPPILIHRLPWLLFEHPETVRPEEQPY